MTQRVSPATRIVFISSVKSYAVMAFEERANSYLVLPVTQKDVDEAVLNIRRRDYWRRGD
jgi:two-component SAPR family response regulator